MILANRKILIAILTIIVFGAGLISLANYSAACRLGTVVMNGAELTGWSDSLPLLKPTSVLAQPLDSLAAEMITCPDIYQVDMSFSGLQTLQVTTNRFDPECILVDAASGCLYGLDYQGRLLPLEHSPEDWECPLITGLKKWKLFACGEDGRLPVVMEQVGIVKRTNPDLARLVDEIYFDKENSVRVSISGLPYTVRVRPDGLALGLERLVEFITGFQPELANIKMIDLRFETMIVTTEGGKGNG